MHEVLDSSAVLALLRAEHGSELVLAALPRSVMSSVNEAEVLRVLVRGGASLAGARRVFRRLHLPVIAFDFDDAALTAEVAGIAPALSLGDCACLALARRLGNSRVLTADRAWSRVNFGVAVQIIR